MNKSLDERIVDMRVTREAANGIFWLFLAMLIGSLVLKGLGVNVWLGAPWTAITIVMVSHQVSRAAKRWLKLMNVPSEYSEPFDFDLDTKPSDLQSNGATEEMNYRAHA